MKRLGACIGILATIALLALWGGFAVHTYQKQADTALDGIQQEISAGNARTAAAAADAYLKIFRRQEHVLSIFIRRDYLATIDVTLCAVRQYARENNADEALAEIARARSQNYAVCHLFFRML